jgi:hypothetical protein
MTKNILKKSIFTLLLGIILTLNSLPLVVVAQDTNAAPATPAPAATTNGANVTENELFQKINYKGGTPDKSKIAAVNSLPDATWQQTLSSLVKTLLNISGALTLIALTVGGVFMITAHGSTDMLDKGKKIVMYSIAGLVVIAVSYAVVIGVSELQFFTPGSTRTTAPGTPAAGVAPSTSVPSNTGSSGGTLNGITPAPNP